MVEDMACRSWWKNLWGSDGRSWAQVVKRERALICDHGRNTSVEKFLAHKSKATEKSGVGLANYRLGIGDNILDEPTRTLATLRIMLLVE